MIKRIWYSRNKPCLILNIDTTNFSIVKVSFPLLLKVPNMLTLCKKGFAVRMIKLHVKHRHLWSIEKQLWSKSRTYTKLISVLIIKIQAFINKMTSFASSEIFLFYYLRIIEKYTYGIMIAEGNTANKKLFHHSRSKLSNIHAPSFVCL